MHAVHLSPHTVEMAKSAAERSAAPLAAIAAVGIVALVLVATSWYLWQFT